MRVGRQPADRAGRALRPARVRSSPASGGLIRLRHTARPVVSGAQTGASVGSGGNYLFDDEFDGTAVNPSLWSVIDRGGDASNHEAQCYLPANVSEGNGNLRITSKVDSSCKGYRHTSGMVQWATATFTYGSIEIRAKQSGGQGRCHPPTRTGTSTA